MNFIIQTNKYLNNKVNIFDKYFAFCWNMTERFMGSRNSTTRDILFKIWNGSFLVFLLLLHNNTNKTYYVVGYYNGSWK